MHFLYVFAILQLILLLSQVYSFGGKLTIYQGNEGLPHSQWQLLDNIYIEGCPIANVTADPLLMSYIFIESKRAAPLLKIPGIL